MSHSSNPNKLCAICKLRLAEFFTITCDDVKCIRALNEFRNKLAHGIGVWDVDDNDKTDRNYFNLTFYKGGKMQSEKITLKAIEEKLKDVDYSIGMLSRLLVDVVTKAEPKQ